ncbi:MAG: KH domain-containing protein [Dehalococcoidia bacterium]|nr:MAG: KH domain-containing protein [Dehalococcoidia bacterium]
MESLETSAKTVEEAVALALEKLGASRDQVEVVVLKEGKPGFLGLGGEEATVRVLRRQSEEERQAAVILAKEVLERLLSLMKVSASIEEKEPPEEGRALIFLEITGDDLGILIGRRGQTLSSLQYLLYLMVGHQLKAHVPVTIDVAGYRERRQEALKNLAWRIAESVMATGQPVPLEPMPASERRIIHLALQDYPGVITQSIGEGEDRKVTILKQG